MVLGRGGEADKFNSTAVLTRSDISSHHAVTSCFGLERFGLWISLSSLVDFLYLLSILSPRNTRNKALTPSLLIAQYV